VGTVVVGVGVAFKQVAVSRFVFPVIFSVHDRVPVPFAFNVYRQRVPPVVVPQVIEEFLYIVTPAANCAGVNVKLIGVINPTPPTLHCWPLSLMRSHRTEIPLEDVVPEPVTV
jgi:hypothetical protein